jgi:hypothetical protein
MEGLDIGGDPMSYHDDCHMADYNSRLVVAVVALQSRNQVLPVVEGLEMLTGADNDRWVCRIPLDGGYADGHGTCLVRCDYHGRNRHSYLHDSLYSAYPECHYV